jgi:hypothetical protein
MARTCREPYPPVEMPHLVRTPLLTGATSNRAPSHHLPDLATALSAPLPPYPPFLPPSPPRFFTAGQRAMLADTTSSFARRPPCLSLLEPLIHRSHPGTAPLQRPHILPTFPPSSPIAEAAFAPASPRLLEHLVLAEPPPHRLHHWTSRIARPPPPCFRMDLLIHAD